MHYEEGYEDNFIGLYTRKPDRPIDYYLSCTGKWHPYVGGQFHPTKKIWAQPGEQWIDVPMPAELYYPMRFFFGAKGTTLGFHLNEWMSKCKHLPSEQLPKRETPNVAFKSHRNAAYATVFNAEAKMKEQKWGTMTGIVSYSAWERFEQLCEQKGQEPLREVVIYTWASPGFIAEIEEHQLECLNAINIPRHPPGLAL